MPQNNGRCREGWLLTAFGRSDKPQSCRNTSWFAPRSSPSPLKLCQCPLANDTSHHLHCTYNLLPPNSPHIRNTTLCGRCPHRAAVHSCNDEDGYQTLVDVLRGVHWRTAERPVRMPLCPPQIPHRPDCNRTWVPALTGGDCRAHPRHWQLKYDVRPNKNIRVLSKNKHELNLIKTIWLKPLIKITANHLQNHTKKCNLIFVWCT